MTVLVTGGAGFIGSHFVEYLLAAEPDTPVVVLDDFNDFYDPAIKRRNVAAFAGEPRVTLAEGDFCDEALVGELFARHAIERVVHLGGYAGVRASLARPLRYHQANVRGTLVLLEAARAQQVTRFVLASSSTVYGQGVPVPFVEDAPLGVPLSPYGVTKQEAELWGWHYDQVHGVPVVCLRPFSVYGARTRPDLALHLFASAIARGQPIRLLGDGTQRRDFTHVSDVCAGMYAALMRDGVAGEAINLGHHEPVEILEVVRLLEAELGRKATIEPHPAAAADMPVTCADLTKARRLLGYQPRVALADGVRDFVRWFRAQAE